MACYCRFHGEFSLNAAVKCCGVFMGQFTCVVISFKKCTIHSVVNRSAISHQDIVAWKWWRRSVSLGFSFHFFIDFFVWFNTPHNIPWFECFIANARDTMFRERTTVISLYHLIRWGSTRLIVTWRSSVFMAVKSRAPKWHTARCTCASKTGRSVESLYRSPSLLTDGESWRDAATFSRSFWRG